jgi:poly-beta-1,6-N-acetyl-D-glucosamine synthase
MTEILFYLFIIVGLINMAHIGMYIAGANLYDMWQLRRRSSSKRKRTIRPLVSIMVPAHNEALVIERCLDSVRKSTYRKLEIIVHNDRSTDDTAKLVTRYKKQYPWLNLRLINRRHQVGKGGGLNYSIKRYAKGELIMTLDADCILRRDAIKKAVDYFDDQRVVGVAANVRLLEQRTVLGVLQRFEHLIGYRSKKFYTVSNSEFIIGGVASTYRRSILEAVGYYDTDTATEDIGLSMKIAALGNRQHRLIYAADVVASTEGAHNFMALLKQRYRWKMGSLQNLFCHLHLIGQTQNGKYSRSLTWYRLPMAIVSEIMLLIQPFILAYIVALSFASHSLALFIGAYITITIYTLWTILPDEHSVGRHKLAMAAYAPLLYFTFYIMDLVQIISIVRCLMHPRELTRRNSKKEAIWVSPERVGQQAQFS